MKIMKNLNSDRTDRALMSISLIIFLICLLFLNDENLFKKLFGYAKNNNETPPIGKIIFAENDIRHRIDQSITWEKASSKQSIHLGDSVFTGLASRLSIELSQGGKIDLNENSLVKFTKDNQIEIPNFMLGSFKLSANQDIKIALNGKVYEIQAKNSEIKIDFKNNIPQLSLLRGKAQIKINGKIKDLTYSVLNIQSEKIAKQIESEQFISPNIINLNDEYTYKLKLLDLYGQNNNNLFKLENVAEIVDYPLNLIFEKNRRSQEFKTYAEITNSSKEPQVIEQSWTDSNSFNFNQVFLGKNIIRITQDQSRWTKKPFFIKPVLLNDLPPIIQQVNEIYWLENQSININLAIDSKFTVVLAEISRSNMFNPQITAVRHITNNVLSLKFKDPGVFYIQLRGLNNNNELSHYSQTYTINLQKPAEIFAPALTRNEIEVFENDPLVLSWKPNKMALQYHLKCIDSNNQICFEKTTTTNNINFSTQQIGNYKIELRSVDKFLRRSKTASTFSIRVKPKPRLAELRKPATVTNQISEKISQKVPEYLNRNFDSSKVEVHTSAFTMYSAEQINAKKSNPTAMLVGLHWSHWLGRHGIESLISSKVVDIDNKSNSDVSPLQLEARYRYRMPMSFGLFSDLHRSELSIISGYEVYRNSGSGLFSSGYSLFKTGLGLNFPLLSRWDTGGELLYGFGLDQSKKYEISGYFNYYYDLRMSLGLGYRVHLFQAGSAAASPVNLLPYREGFGEGYSVLRWHY